MLYDILFILGYLMMDVKISSTGIYLPKNIVHTKDLLDRFGVVDPNIEKHSGVYQRHVASEQLEETTSKMAAWAIVDALERANISKTDLDLILFASAAFEQPVPDTAVLVQKHLGISSHGTPCFSIHATCLGFLQALDVAAAFINSKRYTCIAIVCSEISSKAINPHDPSSYVLFGDAAAAAIVTPAQNTDTSKILHSYMTTFGEAAHYTEIIAGGTRKHPNHHTCTQEEHSFSMKGKEILKFTLPKSSYILDRIWPNLQYNTDDFVQIITHQPSRIGLLAFQKFFPKEKTISTLHKYGNCVSASLPLTLHEAICLNRLQRGDQTLLFGMGAGVSIGGMVIRY